MHWKRKLITKPIKPKSPNLVRWLFAFIVVLFVLFGLIYVSSQYGFLPFLSVNSLQVLLYFLGAYLLSFLKRIWEGKNLSGLIERRESEAKLFEKGMNQ